MDVLLLFEISYNLRMREGSRMLGSPWHELEFYYDPKGEGGTCQNFDRDARPIFWV